MSVSVSMRWRSDGCWIDGALKLGPIRALGDANVLRRLGFSTSPGCVLKAQPSKEAVFQFEYLAIKNLKIV